MLENADQGTEIALWNHRIWFNSKVTAAHIGITCSLSALISIEVYEVFRAKPETRHRLYCKSDT